MGNGKSRDFSTYVQVTLLICTLAVGSSWYSLWSSYVATLPRTRQAETGRTIPLVSHGVVVYLTEDERHKLTVLNRVGEGLALILVLFSVWKEFIRPGPEA